MKFNLVFLFGLCALASASNVFEDIPKIERVKYDPRLPSNLIITDGLANTIDNFIQRSVNEFNTELDKFENESTEIELKVGDIIQKAKDLINDGIAKIADKIAELKKKGGAIKKCAEIHEVEIREVKEFALKGIAECAKSIAKALKEFAVEVGIAATELKLNIDALVKLVLNCYNQDGTIAIAKCAIKSIKQATQLITEIVGNTKDLIVIVKEKANIFAQSVSSCKQNYVDVALGQIGDVRGKLDECYKNEIN